MDWQAARVSIALAVLTTLLLLPIGILIARWLDATQSRTRPWIEALLLLPLLLPPTVLGFYLLNAWGAGSALGNWLKNTLGVSLVFSFEGLLIASLLINLPFMVQPIQRAFAAIDHSIREAAWVGGLSATKTFFKIELPMAWQGVVAGCAMTFAHTLGEFGVVLLVGGNIDGKTRTLSIAIYDKVQAFDIASAHIMAATLLVFSLIALVAVFASQSDLRKRPQ